jgi:anti-sigma regulatory factor (Ser/Thr protein kinase)
MLFRKPDGLDGKRAGDNAFVPLRREGTILVKVFSAITDTDAGTTAGIPEQIAELCTILWADLCAIYLRSHGPHPYAFAARDMARMERLQQRPLEASYGIWARECGIESVLEEPLWVAGRSIGTLVLGFSSAQRLPRTAKEGVPALISMLATSVDQAEQLARHYRISQRLQRAMLPAHLASADGLVFDAAYRPASTKADVGGDWYDTFEIGNGAIGISVGDVIGHGLEAAVAMSEMRSAIRTTAATTLSPSAMLNHLEDVIGSQSIGMASAVVGIYHPATGVLRYASAGHPAPVFLTSGGSALFLPGGGVMLGLGMPPASEETTVTIPPGATVFFYTDGLLEYGHDPVEGELALLRAVESLGGDEERYAHALHAALFSNGTTNADDCATLALHRAREPIRSEQRYHFSAIPISATLAREALRQFTEEVATNGDRRFDLITAVGEAVANAIEHGDHETGSVFELEARTDADSLVVDVRSRGHWRPFTPSYERGRGIPIMRSYADSFEIASTQEETRVTLGFKL